MPESPSAPDIIGLVPAAGLATRLGPLPVSKEIYPLATPAAGDARASRATVVCEYLLSGLHRAGVRQTYIVLRDGKWDIPAYLRDGSAFGMNFAYLMMGAPHGAPFTIDQAYPFLGPSRVALGFPDILFEPEDPYSPLLSRLTESDADVVLGVFPAVNPSSCDMVEIDDGRVARLEIKPAASDLQWTWALAVWEPSFTEFLHESVQAKLARRAVDPSTEHYIGGVLQEAMAAGLRVDAVVVSEEPFLDIGTPEGLAAASRRAFR